MQAITDETDLPTAVALARGTGACAVKIYADLPAHLVAAITAEAHHQGLAVWAHASVFPALPLDVVAAGVDVLSHVSLVGYQEHAAAGHTYRDRLKLDPSSVDVDGPAVGEVFARMRESGAILDATAGMWLSEELASEPNAEATARLTAALTARAFREGVAVSAGTDVETPADAAFPSLFDELAFLHERCGIPAADVLRSATSVGARSAWVADRAGTVEAGKLADFVILDEDPVADLAHLRSVSCTVKHGRRFPRQDYLAGASEGGER
jgi:imidazolonepropionase-like amidohydrolase